MSKLYVSITAEHDIEGNIKPLILNWENGRTFKIDKILDVCQVPSLTAGEHVMRYTCRIRDKEVFLFHDGQDGKWSIER